MTFVTYCQFFFSLVKKSSTIRNFNYFVFRFFNIFFFKISTNSSYTYVRIHCICSSTNISLILILIYNLYAIIKPTILLVSPLNMNSLATSTLNSILDFEATTSPSSCSILMFLFALIFLQSVYLAVSTKVKFDLEYYVSSYYNMK